MQDVIRHIAAEYNYSLYVILMMIGLWAMIAKNNLVKKIAGMSIFQTAIILFYISIGYKKGATIPIVEHVFQGADHAVRAVEYMNPLPHVLMLTAIVVSVSTLGVALALVIKVYQAYGTLEEDELRERMRDGTVQK